MKISVETLYNQFANNNKYDLACENEKTLEAWENLREALTDNLTKSAFLEIEEIVVNAIIAREELGFINGFQCAMQIVTDCVPQVLAEKVGGVA